MADPSPQIIVWEPDVQPMLDAYALLNAASAKQVVAVKNEAKEAEKAAKQAAKAKQDEEKAFSKAVDDELRAAEKANAKEMADAQKKADYLLKLQLQSAKDATKAAEKAERAAANAAKGDSVWTAALKENTAANLLSKSAINQSAEATGKLAAAASLLDPQLGALIMGLQKVEGLASAAATAEEMAGASLAGLGEAAGAFALAAAPVALVLWDIKNAADAAAASQKILEQAQDDQLPLLDAALDAYTELKIQTSGLNDEQKAQAELARAWDRSLAKANAKTQEELDLAQAKLDAMSSTNSAYIAQYDLVKGLNKTLEESAGIAAAGLAANLQTLDYTTEQTEADKKGTEAKKEKTAAVKEDTSTQREHDQALASYLALMSKIGDVERSSSADLSKTTAIYMERDKALLALEKDARKAAEAAAELNDVGKIGDAVQAYETARVAVVAEAEAKITAIKVEEAAKQKKAYDELALAIIKMDREQAEQRAANARKTTDSVADAFGSLGDIYQADIDAKQDAADNGNKAAQKAILRDFDAKQKAAAAEAAIQTFLAIATAAASAPPPLNLIPMGVAAAQGFVQQAAIQAEPPPTFSDTARPTTAPVQNYQPTFKKNDIIIAAQDPAEVQRQAGTLGGGGSRWGGPSTARRLAQMNTGWMLNEQLNLVTRGVGR